MPSVRALKTVPKIGIGSCVHFCVRSLGCFERCDICYVKNIWLKRLSMGLPWGGVGPNCTTAPSCCLPGCNIHRKRLTLFDGNCFWHYFTSTFVCIYWMQNLHKNLFLFPEGGGSIGSWWCCILSSPFWFWHGHCFPMGRWANTAYS